MVLLMKLVFNVHMDKSPSSHLSAPTVAGQCVCVCARTLTLLTITSLSSVETFGHSPAC